MRRAESLTTLMYQFSRNLGASNSWKPHALYMDGFIFPFYVFSSILGCELWYQNNLVSILCKPKGHLFFKNSRRALSSLTLTFSDTGGAFSGVKRPWRKDFQTILPVPGLRMGLATLAHSNCLHGIYSSNITLVYLFYLQVVEISIVLVV